MIEEVDYLVVGGGFYGCCLALLLRSVSASILVVEAEAELLNRASRVNQARVHTGFHYPRSALTAVKSLALHQRFASDFPEAIVADFQMLYGIARRRSKVSAKRFLRMFQAMGAPIEPASGSQAALFDADMIEAVFACREYAFDFAVLRRRMRERLDAVGLDVRLATAVTRIEDRPDAAVAHLSTGGAIRARQIFNVTYSQINALLRSADLAEVDVKHELAELALVDVPPELEKIGITVMDGPFFSCMPYPAERLHSLTHVRYTPHCDWTDRDGAHAPNEVMRRLRPDTRHVQMIRDAQRYVPALAGVAWRRSMFDVKTVLLKSEKDDARPILFRRQPPRSRVLTVLGGKIDNVYDLFDLIRRTEPAWARADERFVFAG